MFIDVAMACNIGHQRKGSTDLVALNQQIGSVAWNGPFLFAKKRSPDLPTDYSGVRDLNCESFGSDYPRDPDVGRRTASLKSHSILELDLTRIHPCFDMSPTK